MSEIEYLALPYSDDDEEIMCFRAAVSDYIFAELSNEGRVIYAPISSCHNVAREHDLPTDFNFWNKMCRAFVSASYKVIVIMLPGWEESTGLTAELKLARELGLEIEWLDPIPYIMDNKELKTWMLKLEEKKDLPSQLRALVTALM